MANTKKPVTRKSKVSYDVLSYTFETPRNMKQQVQARKGLAELIRKHRLKRKYTVEATVGSLMEYYDRNPRCTPSYDTLEEISGVDLSRFYE